MVADFWSLGLTPHAVSAISGTGTGEMLDVMADKLPPPRSVEEDEAKDKSLAVAIVGRPNVGERAVEIRAGWYAQCGGGVGEAKQGHKGAKNSASAREAHSVPRSPAPRIPKPARAIRRTVGGHAVLPSGLHLGAGRPACSLRASGRSPDVWFL
jgi:hypothetical protein